MKNAAGIVLALILSFAFMSAIFGCALYSEYDASETSGVEPPPPWEQQRGVGSEWHYYYYPQVKIYYNLEREVYFYYHKGQWQVASQLPSDYKTTGRRVTIDMYEEEPYKWQPEIEKRFPAEPE